MGTGLLKTGQVLGNGGVLGTGLLSGSNQQAQTTSSSSSSRGNAHFYEQNSPKNDQYISLKDPDTEDATEYSVQPEKPSVLPALPLKTNLIITPPVRIAGPSLTPPMRTHVANQITVSYPGQSEMKGQGSADKSDVIGQGSLDHKGVTPPRQFGQESMKSPGYSDHTLSAQPDITGVRSTVSGSGLPADDFLGSAVTSRAAASGSYGQSGPGSSGGFGQSREEPINGQLGSGKTGGLGQSGMGLMSG